MRLSSFRYKDENTSVHVMDPRVKILLIGALSSVLILADFWQIAIIGTLILFLGRIGKVNFVKSFWETRVFLILLTFIFLVHTLFSPGVPLFSFWVLKVTTGGMIHGGKIVSRLILIVSLGFLYSSTTSPEGTRAAFEWFLRPFPVNEKVLGTSASIGIRFFPIVVEEVQRTQEAQKARFIEGAGILRRLKSLVSLLIIRTFKRAERVSLAMDSRCYSTERSSRYYLTISAQDHVILAAVLVLTILLYLSVFY